jgi:hypothetical protein
MDSNFGESCPGRSGGVKFTAMIKVEKGVIVSDGPFSHFETDSFDI